MCWLESLWNSQTKNPVCFLFSWQQSDLMRYFAGDGWAVNSSSSNFVAQNTLNMVSNLLFLLLSLPTYLYSDMSQVKLSSLNSHGSLLRHQTEMAIIESRHTAGRMTQLIHILYQALSLVCTYTLLTGIRIDESQSDRILLCPLIR